MNVGKFLLFWLVAVVTAVGLTALWYLLMVACVIWCHDPAGKALSIGMSLGLLVPFGATAAILATADDFASEPKETKK
jgi:hypothetical protein